LCKHEVANYSNPEVCGVGERLLKIGIAAESFAKAVPLSVMVVCDDNLKANTLVFNELRNKLAEQGHVAHAAMNFKCGLHTVSLTRRPIALSVPNYWTTLVRLGHLFESSTYRKDFAAALEAVIRSHFKWIPCSTMPPESAAWRRIRAQALKTDCDAPSNAVSPRLLRLFAMEAMRGFKVTLPYGYVNSQSY
jgi:hypothetical protein